MVYPISVDYDGNRGILNKMAYQRGAFAKLEGPVDLVCSSKRGLVMNGELVSEYRLRGRGFDSLNHYGFFYRHVAKHASADRYDYLYIRYPFALPSFLWFLRRAKALNPEVQLIVEIATFPYRDELETPKGLLFRLLDDLGHDHLAKYVDAIVTFYGQSEIFGIRCLRISNGVDVQSIPARREAPSNDQLNLIAVGNIADRHGLDRALQGIAAYNERPNALPVSLQIVGDGPAVPALRALTGQLGIEAQVRFHGLQSGAALDALFDEADLALDSLALHRLHLPRSSSLKAREYCARGVPFVVASNDADFPANLEFVHRVPAEDGPLDIAELVDFHRRLREETPNVHQEMRRYAEDNLTWQVKLVPVVEHLRAQASRRMR